MGIDEFNGSRVQRFKGMEVRFATLNPPKAGTLEPRY